MPGNYLRPVNASWVPQRLSFFFWVFLLVSLGLVVRLANLGIVHGDYYAQFSEKNFLIKRPISAPRGTIHDRQGTLLAYNRATFEVSMSPGNLSAATLQVSLDRLGPLLGADLSESYQPVVHLKPRWTSRVLARGLTLDQATKVFEQRYALPGVAIEPQFERHYPLGSTLCHLLGYVGKIPAGRVEEYRRAGYERDEDVGIVGLEAAFENSLKGEKGLEHVWETGRGRILDSQVLDPPTPGGRLYLTIDLPLQQLAESLLVGQCGVILAIHPQSGEMLAWASSPVYDLNRPGVIDNPSSKPLINRAIQEYYSPGSSFKIMTALAALQAGWPLDRRVTCDHTFFLPNWSQPFKCLGWHGSMELVSGFQHSCNVFFYTMADFVWRTDPQDAGYQLVRTAQRFGFGDYSGVLESEGAARSPGFRERRGTLPTLGRLQRERGTLLHLAIGQGPLNVTPLQMLLAYTALANGGELLVPRLVREVRSEENTVLLSPQKTVRRTIAINPEHRQAIIRGLVAAVNEEGGTAHDAGFLKEWRVAGKTSTAEIGEDVEPHAWFIGFAPAENPQLAVLVLIEHGGHGGKVAAPLGVKLFAQYFNHPAAPTTLASH